MRRKIICRLLCALLALGAVETIHAQGTAFLYQGRLNDGGSPATGNYDLRFAIYDAVSNGNAISFPLTNSATAVSNGLFTATLDFGAGIFTGTNYWLQIGVQTNGMTNAFITLVPRQPVLPVPYAIFANGASNLFGTLAATQLSGTLPSSAFAGYTNTVSLTNSANLFSGTFSGTFKGNGGNVTNVNVANLTGVLVDSQLPANVPYLNSNQIFSAANNFTNFGNSFVGSFFGNGLVGWIPTNGTAVQAVIDTGYLLTNSQLVTVTLPVAPNAGDIVRISGAGAGGWKVAQNANQSVQGNFSSFSNAYWKLTAASAPQNWDSIAMSADASKLIASTLGGGVYASLDSGLTWVQTNSTAGTWRSVACSSDGSKLYAARFGGGIYTNSPATSWGLSAVTAGLNWFAIACSADGTKLVAAISNNASGGVYTSGDSGGTWFSTGAAPANWVSVASSADGTKLVAAIFGGGIYTSANWATPTSAGNRNWVSVASSADGTKLAAVVSGGVIYTSGNSGSTWVTNNVPVVNWQSIASSADGSKLAAVIHSGGIYLSSDFGSSWAQVGAPSANWSSIASSSDGTKLAATIYGGGIYTSQTALQSTSTTGMNGYINGAQGSAVELQYIGGGQFMPVSSAGTIWAK
jgi:hypothetical protein